MLLIKLKSFIRFTLAISFAVSVPLFVVGCGDSGDIGSTNGTPIVPTPDPGEDNGSFSISAPTTLSMSEGGNGISISVQAFRNQGHSRPISLSIEGVLPADNQNLSTDFSQSTLDLGANETTLNLQVNVGMSPILTEQRDLRLTATDGLQSEELILAITVQPIDAPDVYLLIGQSNMVGFSGNGKEAQPGGLDEPHPRILQLNVTGNDVENFGAEENFTDTAKIAAFPRIASASDPLHESFDPSIQGKSGAFIGLGMTFAKSALADTEQNIVLVPAAWSATGFCNNGFEHIAWNATEPAANQDHLGGTALHDRAIARTNLALAETGGILRGILWHQGEADATQAPCANDYADNLESLIRSLRTNIQADARGTDARGPNADIPFILGTMSRGNDERGSFSEFDDFKTTVDNVHRMLPDGINSVATSINDDLIPAAFPCGQGSCIHFGPEAYREMGRRYYEKLSGLWSAP